jgi:hypothetical protein
MIGHSDNEVQVSRWDGAVCASGKPSLSVSELGDEMAHGHVTESESVQLAARVRMCAACVGTSNRISPKPPISDSAHKRRTVTRGSTGPCCQLHETPSKLTQYAPCPA